MIISDMVAEKVRNIGIFKIKKANAVFNVLHYYHLSFLCRCLKISLTLQPVEIHKRKSTRPPPKSRKSL